MARASHNVLKAGSPTRAWNLSRSGRARGAPKNSTGPRGVDKTAPAPQGEASVVMTHASGKLRERTWC
eukprot:5014506-Alexandrium_andersonii.AAC.1